MPKRRNVDYLGDIVWQVKNELPNVISKIKEIIDEETKKQ